MTIEEIGRQIKSKHPGSYDDLSDFELGQLAVRKKDKYKKMMQESIDRAQAQEKDTELSTGEKIKTGLKAAAGLPLGRVGAGLASRAARLPQSLTTIGAKHLGRVAGQAQQAVEQRDISKLFGPAPSRETLRELGRTGKEVLEGATEGPFAATDMPTPGDELGMEGATKFFYNVVSDPMTLVGLLDVWGNQRIQKKIQEHSKNFLEEYGEKFYENVANPSTTQEARIYEKITDDVVETSGQKLKKYGYKGGLADINQQIKSQVQTDWDEVIKAARETDEVVDMRPVVDDALKASDDLEALGHPDKARTFEAATEELLDRADWKEELSAEEALRLKRFYDQSRVTSRGNFSEADTVAKHLSDALRKQLNNIDEVGEVNKRLSEHYDLLSLISKELAKHKQKIPGLTWKFPWLQTGIDPTAPKLKAGDAFTALGKSLGTTGTAVKRALRGLSPGLLNQLMREVQGEP